MNQAILWILMIHVINAAISFLFAMILFMWLGWHKVNDL
ncbi:putative membrane protein [Serratia plymuthica A30]|nr:putative membrane protein [Serratia plymuthica A30]